MPKWLPCLIVTLLLAGCSTTTPETTTPEDTPSTLGKVSGAAVTADIRPVDDAVITMQPGNFAAETNLFGGFTFSNVPPGTYEVTATHPEFEPTTQIIDVMAGTTTKARLILKSNEPPTPQHVTETFPGFVPVWAGAAENATTALQEAAGVGNCTCVFDIQARANMETMVIEALWTDSVDPPQPTQFRWTLDVGDNLTLTGTAPKPLRVVIEADDVGGWNATDLQLSLVPDDLWPATDQQYTLYVTIFQVEPAPPGWSFLGN